MCVPASVRIVRAATACDLLGCLGERATRAGEGGWGTRRCASEGARSAGGDPFLGGEGARPGTPPCVVQGPCVLHGWRPLRAQLSARGPRVGLPLWVKTQKFPDTPGSLEGNTEGPTTASSEPPLPP